MDAVTRRKSSGRGGVREGAGRPPLGPDAKSEPITLKVTPAKLATINSAAFKAGMTRHAWLTLAVDAALARR